MNDILQIKCPECGAILTIKNQPGLDSKSLTCPSCEIKNPFIKFKRLIPQPQQDPTTDYGYGHKRPHEEEKTQYRHSDDHTQYRHEDNAQKSDSKPNLTIGALRLAGTNTLFQLKPGRNVIGRKSSNSGANFQINTGDKRSMSREHIVIDVKNHPGQGLIHCLSLYKEKVNKTFIGGEELLPGDIIILQPGDIIKLPDAALQFEIPDEERTQF